MVRDTGAKVDSADLLLRNRERVPHYQFMLVLVLFRFSLGIGPE